MSDNTFLDIKLMGREYRVTCELDQQKDLLDAANLLNDKLREAAGRNRSAQTERIAIMVALNLAHELLEQRTNNSVIPEPSTPLVIEPAFDIEEAKRRITDMGARIDSVLGQAIV